MHSLKSQSPVLTVYVQVQNLPQLLRQRLQNRAEAEAFAILSRHQEHDIWVHIFEMEGSVYALSSRMAGINGCAKIIVDVSNAAAGLTRRTIVKARQAVETKPPGGPKDSKRKSKSKLH